jgi:hypothetical protein
VAPLRYERQSEARTMPSRRGPPSVHVDVRLRRVFVALRSDRSLLVVDWRSVDARTTTLLYVDELEASSLAASSESAAGEVPKNNYSRSSSRRLSSSGPLEEKPTVVCCGDYFFHYFST